MKFANAIKLDRKSGVRLGERGAPVRFPRTFRTSFDVLISTLNYRLRLSSQAFPYFQLT
jgi:hypothetical protein